MKSFRRLLQYLSNYKLFVALNIFCNILTAVFTVIGIPLLNPFLKVLFDRAESIEVEPSWSFEKNGFKGFADYLQNEINYQLGQLVEIQGKEKALIYVCITILAAFFLKNLFRYLSLFFMAPVRNGMIRDMRRDLFDKMLALPLAYFSNERKGDLMSRITADVQEVEASILNMLEIIFREPIIIFGSLMLMIAISPTLTGFVFLLMIFTAVVIGGIGRSLKRRSSQVQEKLGVLATITDEALGGMRIVKGFNAEKYQREKFAKENNHYRWILTRVLWRRELASPLSEFLGIGVVALLLWYGSRQVFAGALEAETFITFIFAFYLVIDPAKSFSKAYYNIQKGLAAMQRVEEVLDVKEEIVETPNAQAISSFDTNIEYRNVTFNYKSSEFPVLKNINLTIPKGKIIALVGASGAGKSTLVDLLPRFYDVIEGGVFVDGLNIKDYKIKDLRSLMGIVSQEAILFNDTIYNNIVFGLENVTEADVIRAAKIANAHEFIINTENGYQTNIGDRGNKLSGGQRQRLTIARAILKNPPILILDEATSALDSESEKLVQGALVELMKNRTSIVIAHRLSTIQHADEIIVMRDGKIKERGTHRQLLEADGEYHKLVELQAF